MQLLDNICIKQNDTTKKIELFEGDLVNLTKNESFDLLIISATPDEFIPIPNSIIGSLHSRGLSVKSLSTVKEENLREFSCWLSIELNPTDYTGIQFKRILCFEPLTKGQSAPDSIGDLFNSLCLIIERYMIKSVAIPILATGAAMFPISKILPNLIKASFKLLNRGIDLDVIKIVAYKQEQAAIARKIFTEVKEELRYYVEYKFNDNYRYDYYVSYSHEDITFAKMLLEFLHEKNKNFKIFFDKKDIHFGSWWQNKIDDALDDSKQIFALISPGYLNSKICMEEYQIARFRQRASENIVLIPVYIYTTYMPTYMSLTQYHDCREGSKEKLKELVRFL